MALPVPSPLVFDGPLKSICLDPINKAMSKVSKQREKKVALKLITQRKEFTKEHFPTDPINKAMSKVQIGEEKIGLEA